MTAHTPGPWLIGKGRDTVYTEDDIVVALCAEDILSPLSSAEYEANARLIAAAPAMLDACQEALNTVCLYLTHYPHSDQALTAKQRLVAAIAAAKGE